MKVKHCIKRLNQLNPEAEVRIGSHDGYSAMFIEQLVADPSVVWIETEGDIDLGNEIGTRLDDATENGTPMSKVYEDMLSVGITVEHVRKLVGESEADAMEEYCKSAGLSAQYGKIPKGAIQWCRQHAPEALKELDDGQLWDEMRAAYIKYCDSGKYEYRIRIPESRGRLKLLSLTVGCDVRSTDDSYVYFRCNETALNVLKDVCDSGYLPCIERVETSN